MTASISQEIVTTPPATRLWITRGQARRTAWLLRSAAGTVACYNGGSVVDAIWAAAEHIGSDDPASYAMYARSALVNHLGLDLAPYEWYTVPALQAWQALAPLARVADALNGAAARLLAAVDTYGGAA